MNQLLSKTNLYQSEIIDNARQDIYFRHGYTIIKNFVDKPLLRALARRWATGQYNYHFHGYLKNTEVTMQSPNYLLNKPGTDDWSFCMHMWNPPIDEELHSICLEAQQIRNLIEGRALFYGLQCHDRTILQYRLSRTLSTATSVFPHADFMEEERKDSMVDHSYDPRRCQMTLFISDYNVDYKDGGFHLQNNQDEQILFGRDIEANAGDLVIWKYSNMHHVGGVVPIDKDIGFSRVIFPMFDKDRVDVSSRKL